MASGEWGPASSSEVEKIKLLRETLLPDLEGISHPELLSDWKFVRFLRGHGDVEQAAVAFRATLDYRKRRGVENIRSELLAGGLDAMPWHPLALSTSLSNSLFLFLAFFLSLYLYL